MGPPVLRHLSPFSESRGRYRDHPVPMADTSFAEQVENDTEKQDSIQRTSQDLFFSLYRDEDEHFESLLKQHDSPPSFQTKSQTKLRRCYSLAYRTSRRLIRLLRICWPLIKYLLLLFTAVVLLCPILFPSYTTPPTHYKQLAAACSGSQAQPGCANPRQERVFINVALYDKDGKLLSGLYGENLLSLIHILGEKNVFLSIYENNSASGGITALDNFRKRLPCQHELVHESNVSLDDFPTVTMRDGTQRTKRLSYLTELRNRGLRPLDRFNETIGAFDKILFLNDVFYKPIDAAQLLFSTNLGSDGKEQYLATCALDYCGPSKFYDSYATRDADGFTPGEQVFPIFTPAGRALSRQDMFDQTDAVRVSSCWSGMVAVQAKWVQNLEKTLPRPDFQDIAAHVIDPDKPKRVVSPVRFRYEPEIFVDSCECCLFLADLLTVARNAGASQLGVYMNPFVRITYKANLLPAVQLMKYWERALVVPQTIISWLRRLPESNPHRTVQEGDEFSEEIWVPDAKGSGKGHWELKTRKGRNGLFCWNRKMHLIRRGGRKGDVNWEKAWIPWGGKQ